MPTRTKARLIKVTTPIQGGDAYIIVKNPSWGDLVALDKGTQEKDWSAVGKVLANLVSEWNWVDYDGTPLPLPSQEGTLSLLSTDEVTALSAAIGDAVKPPLASSPASSST